MKVATSNGATYSIIYIQRKAFVGFVGVPIILSTRFDLTFNHKIFAIQIIIEPSIHLTE